jgi:hypothetical protein
MINVMDQPLRGSSLTLATVVAGLWLGEHLTGPDGFFVALGGAVIFAVFAALPFRTSWRALVLRGLIGLLAFGLPWAVGANEASLAFNSCVGHGEEVRTALGEYRTAHGHYPARLSQLQGHIPCGLVLPPGLLKYRPTKSGYSLSFSDWLVSHEASEAAPFMAHK